MAEDSRPHSHDHTEAFRSAGRQNQCRLAAAFGLIGGFFVVEAVAGWLTGSLALLSDAGHMLTDVIGLGMALAAVHLAGREQTDRQRSFGVYRLEVLAALLNTALLFGVGLYVLVEAVERWRNPAPILGLPMLIVAVLGLAANVAAFLLLRSGADKSLNVEGAYLEVLSDLLGSVGVIVAAIVIQVTGWRGIDAMMAAGIGLFILPRTWRLGAKALRILMQVAPEHIGVEAVEAALCGVPGVAQVHDVHVWTLTSGMEVVEAHLRASPGADLGAVLADARARLETTFHVEHATLQVEPHDGTGCRECGW